MALDASILEGPTLDNFVLDLSAPPSSPWNTKAVKLFVEDFNRVDWYTDATPYVIKERFIAHFKTLQAQFKTKTELAQQYKLSRASMRGRKRSVCFQYIFVHYLS
jgi:hypothetical protein